jgi:hypothetical protein
MIIKINGYEFASPPSFTPSPKPMYAGSMVNGNGKTISNYIGDKMDFPLAWDYMPIEKLAELQLAIQNQPIIFEYIEDGIYKSFETRRTAGITKSELCFNKQKKSYEWHKINLKLEEL